MERAVLLINREQRAKVASLAAKEHVSAAEIHRRAIDSYMNEGDIGEANFEELEQLAETVLAANKKAMSALEDAHHAMLETLAVLQIGKNRYGCQ